MVRNFNNDCDILVSDKGAVIIRLAWCDQDWFALVPLEEKISTVEGIWLERNRQRFYVRDYETLHMWMQERQRDELVVGNSL